MESKTLSVITDLGVKLSQFTRELSEGWGFFFCFIRVLFFLHSVSYSRSDDRAELVI